MKNILKILGVLCLVSTISFEITCSVVPGNLRFLKSNIKWLDDAQVQTLTSAKHSAPSVFAKAVTYQKTKNERYCIETAQKLGEDPAAVQRIFNETGYQDACNYLAPSWHTRHPSFASYTENEPLLDTQSACCCTLL